MYRFIRRACAALSDTTLLAIGTLKRRLVGIIEPDFGLLDELLALGVLTLRQVADVRREKTVYRRNNVLLDLLLTEDRCNRFTAALRRTEQQHVANLIESNGGKTRQIPKL